MSRGSFSRVLAPATFSSAPSPSLFLSRQSTLSDTTPASPLFLPLFYYFSFFSVPWSMLPTRMSATARAATLRSRAPALRAPSQQLASRASAFSSVSAQTLVFSSSRRTALPASPLSATQLISPFAALPLTRSFHVATALWQQKQQQPSQEQQKEEKKDEDGKPEDKSEGEQSKEEKGEEKKEDASPPPPHGDKTPWQVFRETLQTEFKASKEWNESTKALASSAHELSENENVKRARAAYEAASGAAQTRTSAALKTTGQAIGKSAAWTWNTPVVKGVRKGVTATGSGIERATRPVRETEAYRNVKDTLDDGSSSRYGGWVEKEERRKQRKRREELEAKTGKRQSGPLEEDPE